MIWDAWRRWQRTGRRTSEELGYAEIDPLVAHDLDDAVALFGQHVDSEIELGISELREKRRSSGSDAGSKTLTREEIREEVQRIVAREVDRKLRWVLYEAGAMDPKTGLPTPGPRYVVTKDITGDPMIDGGAFEGPHRRTYDDGRVLDYDADGNRV